MLSNTNMHDYMAYLSSVFSLSSMTDAVIHIHSLVKSILYTEFTVLEWHAATAVTIHLLLCSEFGWHTANDKICIKI